jgi:DNA-binding CsgD family transcriptional regulator
VTEKLRHPAPPFERVPPLRGLTVMQELVCNLLAANLSYAAIGEELHITPGMVRFHAKRAAKRLPGDLPTLERCRAWARGASLEVLTGAQLKAFLLTPLRSGGAQSARSASYIGLTEATGAQ